MQVCDLTRACGGNVPPSQKPATSNPYLVPLESSVSDERIDSYSVGVIMHKMLFGQTPMSLKPHSTVKPIVGTQL